MFYMSDTEKCIMDWFKVFLIVPTTSLNMIELGVAFSGLT